MVRRRAAEHAEPLADRPGEDPWVQADERDRQEQIEPAQGAEVGVDLDERRDCH